MDGARVGSGKAAFGMPWPSRSQAAWALAVLIFIYAMAFLDRIILSMVITPIQKEMAFSDVQMGFLHGLAFVFFYVIAGFPFGRMADLHSRRRLVCVAAAVWTIGTAACGLATGFFSLFALRVVVGIGEAALSPSAYSLIADMYPAESRSRAVSIYQLGVTGGSTLAYILGGLVVAFASQHGPVDLGFGTFQPWRVTFFMIAIPGILSAILAATIHEPTRRGGAVQSTQGVAGWLRSNKATIATFIFGYGFINMSFSAVIAWAPTWLGRVHHLGPATIGMTLGALTLFAGASGQLLMALRSDRALAKGRNTAVFDTGIVCALALTVAAAAVLLPGLTPDIIFLAAIFFFACGSIGHAPSIIGQIAPNQFRGRLSAIYLLALNLIGAGLGSLLVALFTDHVFHDPGAVGYAIAITSVLGSAIGAVLLYAGRKALDRSTRALLQTA